MSPFSPLSLGFDFSRLVPRNSESHQVIAGDRWTCLQMAPLLRLSLVGFDSPGPACASSQGLITPHAHFSVSFFSDFHSCTPSLLCPQSSFMDYDHFLCSFDSHPHTALPHSTLPGASKVKLLLLFTHLAPRKHPKLHSPCLFRYHNYRADI